MASKLPDPSPEQAARPGDDIRQQQKTSTRRKAAPRRVEIRQHKTRRDGSCNPLAGFTSALFWVVLLLISLFPLGVTGLLGLRIFLTIGVVASVSFNLVEVVASKLTNRFVIRWTDSRHQTVGGRRGYMKRKVRVRTSPDLIERSYAYLTTSGPIMEGSVYGRGWCWLATIPLENRAECSTQGMKCPTTSTLKRFWKKFGRRKGSLFRFMMLRGTIIAHVGTFGSSTLPSRCRVGYERPVTPLMRGPHEPVKLRSTVIKGVEPTTYPPRDVKHTDHEVRQPYGKWTWDVVRVKRVKQHGMIHEGKWLKPDAKPGQSGFCYLALYKSRYRRVAESDLGRFPTARAVWEHCRVRRRWLREEPSLQASSVFTGSTHQRYLLHHFGFEEGKYMSRHDVTGYVISGLDGWTAAKRLAKSSANDVVGAPVNGSVLGAYEPTAYEWRKPPTRLPSDIRRELLPTGYTAMYGTSYMTRSDRAHDEIVAYIATGCRRRRPLPTDHQVVQPLGRWVWSPFTITTEFGVFAQHEMMHEGEYAESQFWYNIPGFCYLSFFYERYQAVVASDLGPFPTTSDLCAYACRRIRWMTPGELTITLLDKTFETSGYRCVAHTWPSAFVFDREDPSWQTATIPNPANMFGLMLIADPLMIIGVEPGSLLEHETIAVGEEGEKIVSAYFGDRLFTTDVDGEIVGTGLCHPNETLHRYAESPYWHSVSQIVWDSARDGTSYDLVDEELYEAVLAGKQAFEVVCQKWQTGENIVITAWDCAVSEVTRRPVWEVVEGASRGVVFTSTKGEYYHSWVQTQEPTGDHDCLACPQCGVGQVIVSEIHDCISCGHPVVYSDGTFRTDVVAFSLKGTYVHRAGPATTSRFSRQSLLEWCDPTWVDAHGHDVKKVYAVVHPSWDVVLCPIKADEGRVLSCMRLLPLVCGRSDVTISIVNGRWVQNDAHFAKFCAVAGATAVSWSRGILPVDLASFWAQGCAFAWDGQNCLKFIAAFGKVYGADEVYVLNRSPLAIPHHFHHKTDHCRTWTWTENTVLPEVTWLFPADDGIGAWYQAVYKTNSTRRSTIDFMNSHSRDGDGATPVPKGDLWCSIAEAEERALKCADDAGIPRFGWDLQTVSRQGGRYAHIWQLPSIDPDRPRNGQIIPGTMWRRFDVASGLRNQYATHVTQGLSPELWKATDEELGEADPRFISALNNIYEKMTVDFERIPKGSLYFVASVWSQSMLDEYRNERGHLAEGWIFLTERSGLVAGPSDFVYQMPTSHGTGFHFQLARLLPFSTPNLGFYLSCINDLETDWYPREDRLKCGWDCMPFYDIVFPAMDLNCPCPFQDVFGRSGSLLHKKSNLIWSIARFGWIYGYDEVWCCTNMLPTVAFRWVLGGASTLYFKNPKDNPLIQITPKGCVLRWAPGGNFSACFYTNGIEMPVDYKRRTRELDGPIPEGEISLASWEKKFCRRLTILHGMGDKVIAIFVWGTRGDRVPLYAAAAKMREAGVTVVVVALQTIEEGVAGLEQCETEQGYKLVPVLFKARVVLENVTIPFLYPSYFGRIEGGLGVVLRPTSIEAGRPRGGLPYWVDWLVPLINFEAEDIFVARTDLGGYFPRSADGRTFIRIKSNKKTGRKAVVAGSSTTPIPDEFRGWEICPPGPHNELLREYDEIACAGGAGVVQTAKACGCTVRTWSGVIDRTWLKPGDAGADATKEMNDDLWYIIPFYIYPSTIKNIITRPSLWFPALRFYLHVKQAKRLVWSLIFLFVCIRKNGALVMPTFEATFTRALLGPTSGLKGFIYGRTIVGAVKWYKALRFGSWPRMFWSCGCYIVGLIMSADYILLTTIGLNWRTALTTSWFLHQLPSPGDFYGKLKFGSMSTTVTGIWLGLTPVMWGVVPIGIHVALYDVEARKSYQGVHVDNKEVKLGGSFRFQVDDCENMIMPVWIKTSLKSADLPLESGPAGPYSVVWNCQVQIAKVLLKSGRQLGGLTLIAILCGLTSATLMLSLATLCVFIAGSASVTAVAALRPIGLWNDRLEALLQGLKRCLTIRSPAL